jgi:hypothetical protein
MSTDPNVNPYPPVDLPYRVSSLEAWRAAMEKDQIPKMMAIFDERQRVDHEELAVVKAQLAMLVKRDNERSGFLSGGKALITLGLFGAIQVIGLILLIADKV